MRAVIQRVGEASCEVEGKLVGAIKNGVVVFLGVGRGDTVEDAEWLAEKIVNLRIFEDEKGRMNLSLVHTGGEILIIPQFTLYGDCSKGLRPNFMRAASRNLAEELFLEFVELVTKKGFSPQQGSFGAKMRIAVENNGPVTLILESKGCGEN
jgi:D-tyrosyl-tRNA(Tyr) deacylase